MNRYKKMLIHIFTPMVLVCAIIGLLIWQGCELMTWPIHADEAEHAHSSYLIAGGKRQLVDFFQHHLPGLWYLLVPYYWLGGYGAGVLLWGRVISIIGMVVSAWFCFRIGRNFGGKLGGLLAALFFLPFGIANQFLLVRPESIMLPLVLAAIWMGLRFIQEPHRRGWILWSAFLVALSLLFSPRSYIVLFWVWIVFFFQSRRIRITDLLKLVLGSFCGMIIVLLILGWHEEYLWIPKLSVAFSPPTTFLQTWQMLSDRLLIIVGSIAGLLALFTHIRSLQYLSGLFVVAVLLNLVQALSGSCSPSYAWVIPSVLSAVYAACGVVRLGQSPHLFFRFLAGILFFVWLSSAIQALKVTPLMLTPDGRSFVPNPSTLSEEIEEMDGFCRRYEGSGPAWLVWDFDVSYIAIDDVSYFWSVTFDIPVTFRKLGLPSPVPVWLSDIRGKRPFAISKTLVDDYLTPPASSPDWWSWFLNNYRLLQLPRGEYVYWRNDVEVDSRDRI